MLSTSIGALEAKMIRIVPHRISPLPSGLRWVSLSTNVARSSSFRGASRRVPTSQPLASTVTSSQRYYATSDFPIPPTNQQQPNPSPGFSPNPESRPTPGKITRSLRPLIWATLGLVIGMSAGQFLTLLIAPPPMPAPGSPTDTLLTTDIQSRASKLPIVQQLSLSPDWKSWDAYNGWDDTRKEKNFTAGILEGARAIGAYQRIFWNESTGEVVTVFWIGGSVSGWPGVTHGGLLATVLDENLGRCAMLPRKASAVTANLNITFRAPTPTNSFFVIRAWPVGEGSTDRKAYVAGRLEEPSGKVCVEAEGLFVVPKNLKLGELGEQGATGF